MTANDLLRNWQKAAVLTLRVFDFRIFAYALDPFIYASRKVAGFPGLATLDAARIDILRIAEKRSEQRDALKGSATHDADRAGSSVGGTEGQGHLFCVLIICVENRKIAQIRPSPIPLERDSLQPIEIGAYEEGI
jgi:hypothetical protein